MVVDLFVKYRLRIWLGRFTVCAVDSQGRDISWAESDDPTSEWFAGRPVIGWAKKRFEYDAAFDARLFAFW
jgi:hypothetical protein